MLHSIKKVAPSAGITSQSVSYPLVTPGSADESSEVNVAIKSTPSAKYESSFQAALNTFIASSDQMEHP